MDYRTLGNSSLRVSSICLGTMTYGHQNSEQDAHSQLDYALEHGVNFIDTAEMYPVPAKKETQGLTEAYIGSWLKKCPAKRSEVIIASKVAGRGDWVSFLRPYPVCLNRRNIISALDNSLKRLGTDYLDLYQLHWADRPCNYFGQLGYQHIDDKESVPIEETLTVLNELVDAGKIRYIGVSNETAWGTMHYLRLADKQNLPRIVSIQNPYNLLNRSFDINLAEIAIRESVPLLAYSPLAFGVLSGKYLQGKKPANARLTLFSGYKRYTTEAGNSATREFVNLCQKYQLDPSQIAITYLLQQLHVGSVIIGATTVAQLQTNIAAADISIPPAVAEGIEKINKRYSIPCP